MVQHLPHHRNEYQDHTDLNINFLIHDHQRSHHMPHGHKINIGMREHSAIIFDTFSSWKAVIKDGVVTGHDL